MNKATYEKYVRLSQHDCSNNRDECELVHPRIAKITATSYKPIREQDGMPPQYLKWMQQPKVIIGYFNPVTLESSKFNISEVFEQMTSEGKLNVLNNIILNCLDENERSMLFSDLSEVNSGM